MNNKIDFEKHRQDFIEFFKGHGVEFSVEQFGISDASQGFGNPLEWGNTPIIIASKYDIIDNSPKNTKTFIFAPLLKKGVSVITVDGYLRVERYFE